MAVTVTTLLATARMRVFEVTATADADAAAVIPHGFPVIPVAVQLAPVGTAALAALCTWAITSIDATNINVQKGTGVGSGSANPTLRVTAFLPDSALPGPEAALLG